MFEIKFGIPFPPYITIGIAECENNSGAVDPEKTKAVRDLIGFKDGQPPLLISPDGTLALLIGVNADGHLLIIMLNYEGCGYLKSGHFKFEPGEFGSNISRIPTGPADSYGEPIHHD
jgi:hypothetical protein